jgi:hypothetical protein
MIQLHQRFMDGFGAFDGDWPVGKPCVFSGLPIFAREWIRAGQIAQRVPLRRDARPCVSTTVK